MTRLLPDTPGASPGSEDETGSSAKYREAGQASDGLRSRGSARQARFALCGILLLSATLRIWGLYHTDATDENKLVAPTASLLAGPTERGWYPNNARYPHAAYYLNAGVLAVAQRLAPGAAKNVTFVVRTTHLALAVLTTLLVFLLGRRLAGVRVGMLAALFFAVVPLHVKYSHFAHVDIPVTLAMLAATWTAVALWDDGRARWYLLTGLLTGIAAATQYYGILIGIALVLAHVRWVVRADRRFRALVRPAFVFGLLSVVLGALFVSPFSFLQWEEALERYRGLSLRAAGGDLGYTSTSLLWPLLTRSPDWGLSFTVSGVAWEVTLPLFAVAVIGGMVAARRRDARVLVLVLGLSVLLYFIMAWHVRMHAVKRFLFLTPLLSILAAYGLLALGGGWRRAAAVGVVVAVLLNAGWEIGSFNGAYAGGNTHREAVAWAKEHLPHGSVVLQHGPLAFLPGEGAPWRVVSLREEYANIGGRDDRRVADHRARPLSSWLSEERVDVIVIDSRLADRYYEPTSTRLYPEMTASYRAFYNEVRSTGKLLYEIRPRRFVRAGPHIEVYDMRALKEGG